MQQPFLTGKQPILTGVLFLFLIPITKLYSSIWTQSMYRQMSDINIEGISGNSKASSLIFAVKNNDGEAVKAIIRAAAEKNLPLKDLTLAATAATLSNNVVALRALLPELQTEEEILLLLITSLKHGRQEAYELLLDAMPTFSSVIFQPPVAAKLLRFAAQGDIYEPSHFAS